MHVKPKFCSRCVVLWGRLRCDLLIWLLPLLLPAGAASTDGDTVQRGVQFGVVSGSARSILTAERICLNFMQRMSGIATETAAMVAVVAGHKAK